MHLFCISKIHLSYPALQGTGAMTGVQGLKITSWQNGLQSRKGRERKAYIKKEADLGSLG
jgi:hypothetical protein